MSLPPPYSNVDTPATPAPYTCDEQTSVDTSVAEYNAIMANAYNDYMQEQAALQYMDDLWASGNIDAAFMVAETAVIPDSQQNTNDEVDEYAGSENVGAALSGLNTSMQNLFQTGSNDDPSSTSTTGMSIQDATKLNGEMQDMQYDMNTTVQATQADGTTTTIPYLYMVDQASRDQIENADVSIAKKYGIVDSNGKIESNPSKVQDMTNNTFFKPVSESTSGTTDKSTDAAGTDVTDIEGDFETINNTVNGQESTATMNEQNMVSTANTLQGYMKDMYSAQLDFVKTMVQNLKS